jgi:hypothetical protein
MREPRLPAHGVPADHAADAVDEVTCREFVELATDYFEGALSDRTHNQVEEHLVICDGCANYADQLRATVVALRDLHNWGDDAPCDEPSAEVLAALKQRRDGAA